MAASKLKKIFILLDVPFLQEGGGAEVHAYRLAGTLLTLSQDIKANIIVPNPGAWTFHRKIIRDVPTVFVPVPIVKWSRFFWFLYSLEIFCFLLFNLKSSMIHLQGQRAFVPASSGIKSRCRENDKHLAISYIKK